MTTQVKETSLENEEHRKLALEILTALRGLRYGTVEVTIHDGRVVQIDRHERHRYPATGTAMVA
jgi:hypothetical protein